MIPSKILFNFGVFVILVMRLRVRGVMVKYEEPFPPQLPVQVKSRVAFSQYANIPMLSLDEIKEGFPWLHAISAESEAKDGKVADKYSMESRPPPQYIFYYVPSEVTLHNSESNIKLHPSYEEFKSESGRQNFVRDKSTNHRFQVKNHKPTQSSSKELTKNPNQIFRENKFVNEKLDDHKSGESSSSTKSDDLLKEKRKFERLYEEDRDRDNDDQEGGHSESKMRSTNGFKAALTLPKNHRFREKDFPVRNQFSKPTGTRFIPNYLYPEVPSPYMQLPKLNFEEKEYWVKNKRKSKRPIEDITRDEERLKNHRIVKEKKQKNNNPEEEERLKNHKATYDREHDPYEHAESSAGRGQRLYKRPKESAKNPLLLSEEGERIEFQIHGHEGPQSYIFGFDTGNGENRHFRLEERLRDGSVKGHYGYYDSNGKLKMVEYKVSPMGGFEEIHHKSNPFISNDKKKDDETRESENN